MQESTYNLIRLVNPMTDPLQISAYNNYDDLIKAIISKKMYCDSTSLIYLIFYIEERPDYAFTYWPSVEQLIKINNRYEDLLYIGIPAKNSNNELLSNSLLTAGKGISLMPHKGDYLGMTQTGIKILDIDSWIDHLSIQSFKDQCDTARKFLSKHNHAWTVMPWL